MGESNALVDLIGGIVGFVVGLGIAFVILFMLHIILCIADSIGGIIMICLSVKEKNKIKTKGIDESKIKKILILSIWSIVITCVSFLAIPIIPFGLILILPIIALISSCMLEKPDAKLGNVVKVVKKAHLNLNLLIISNSATLGAFLLKFAYKIIKEAIVSGTHL